MTQLQQTLLFQQLQFLSTSDASLAKVVHDNLNIIDNAKLR